MPPETTDDNLAIVHRFMNASGADGRAERWSLLSDELLVKPAGGLPFSGEYRGRPGFFELRTKIDDVVKLTPGPITVRPLGEDAVAAQLRLTFTARSSGKSVEIDVVELYTVRDGQIVELDVYYKDASAVAALLGR
jgi:ketosteroid isomerase-like protein